MYYYPFYPYIKSAQRSKVSAQSHKACQFAELGPKSRSSDIKFFVLYRTLYLPKSATHLQKKLCHETVIVVKLFYGNHQLY